MKTHLHSLRSQYYLVKFYSSSRRMLIYEEFLYIEFFPLSVSSVFDRLVEVCRVAARVMSIHLGRSVSFRIEHKVSSDVALSDLGHLFECPKTILTKYKIDPIRE